MSPPALRIRPSSISLTCFHLYRAKVVISLNRGLLFIEVAAVCARNFSNRLVPQQPDHFLPDPQPVVVQRAGRFRIARSVTENTGIQVWVGLQHPEYFP